MHFRLCLHVSSCSHSSSYYSSPDSNRLREVRDRGPRGEVLLRGSGPPAAEGAAPDRVRPLGRRGTYVKSKCMYKIK